MNKLAHIFLIYLICNSNTFAQDNKGTWVCQTVKGESGSSKECYRTQRVQSDFSRSSTEKTSALPDSYSISLNNNYGYQEERAVNELAANPIVYTSSMGEAREKARRARTQRLEEEGGEFLHGVSLKTDEQITLEVSQSYVVATRRTLTQKLEKYVSLEELAFQKSIDRDIIRISRALHDESLLHIQQNEFEEGDRYISAATSLLEVSLDLTPGVSWAKDCYEALLGVNLVTGEKLSPTERGIAFIGGISFGFGSKFGKAFKIISNTLNRSPKFKGFVSGLQRLFIRLPGDEWSRLFTKSERIYDALQCPFVHKNFREAKGIPLSWEMKINKPSKGGKGVIFYNNQVPQNRIRIMPGNPKSPFEVSRKPYVIHQNSAGKFLDSRGNIVNANNKEMYHIPLDQFILRD